MGSQSNRRQFLHRSLQWSAVISAAHFSAWRREANSALEHSINSNWQIGCYTRPWDKYDYRAALDAIAEAGFKYAGLMTCNSKTGLVISIHTTEEESLEIGEEAAKRNLEILSVYGGGIPVDQSLQAGIEGLRVLIDRCAAVKAKTLLMGGIGSQDLFDAYYKAIAECCDYAFEKKVGLTIKPHGGFNANGPQCRSIIEKVDHKNFRLWYDPGNIYYYSNGELDPVDDAATVDGLVTGMCVKDYLHPKNVLVTPGEGQVNFEAVLARLKKGGFTQGPLVIETLKQGSLREIAVEAQKARKFLQSLGE
ncbi:MAG: sugar phosphate isomerase/epimerase [Candidatus Omnitrophica bacterium]|nr:sugar phosphate isomerase/epimerase [Candidatus Omnitrophota bacterium]